jgi:hypothetical protein
MLSIQTMGNNEVLVQRAFHNYHFWGLLRAIVQLLSFLACAWVLLRKYNEVNRQK